MLIFDQNNLIFRMKNSAKLRQYLKDREYYLDEIKKDSIQMHELRSSNKNLEKFAREKYFMKKDNEDIFLIEEKKLPKP